MDGQSTQGIYWTLWGMAGFGWLKNVARATWVTVNNLYVIPAHCLWMMILWPVTLLFGQDTYLRIEEYFFVRILGMVSFWNATAGYKIAESGDSIDEIFHSNRFLFMPNHQSTADVPLCMTIFSSTGHDGWSKRGSDKVMWIMDKVFKWTNFGVVSWLHDDFFILAGKDNRDKTLDELKAHLKEVFLPKKRRCLVMFPEGGFLRKRKDVSHRFARKNNLPLLEYCTLPRTGALEVIIECLVNNRQPDGSSCNKVITSDHNSNGTNGDSHKSDSSDVHQPSHTERLSLTSSTSLRLRKATTPGGGGEEEQLSKIVDVTIAYPQRDNPLDLLNIITAVRPPCTTHVHYRIFDIKDVPTEAEELRQWMYNLYIEKEAMLQKFYETGVFPHQMYDKNAAPPKVLRQDTSQAVLTNLFYVLSTVFFVWGGCWIRSCLPW